MEKTRMEAGSIAKETVESGFRLLDKVIEFRFALALLSVAVALDVALAGIAHRSILTMDWPALDAGMVARLGLAAVAYVLWMAVLASVSYYAVQRVLSSLADSRLGSALRCAVEPECEVAERRYAWGRVRVNDAKLRALKDKDTFWMAQVEKAEARGREVENEMTALARLSFSVTGLMLMDWGLREHSMAGEIAEGLGGYGGRMGDVAILGLCAIVFVIAFPWLYQVWNPHPRDAWMDHPELAKERLEAIEEERQRRGGVCPVPSFGARR
ncbi:hypothetical protein [Thauera sp. Sel9]|uniref:hypothetical protein n=1 Tax=Thauera sp. Sel9 TaxID=2974299 RepID=UPI0021E17CAA|nr:hypothetical protein [Thauera sp. Sel9]MCV2219862.1 hypothetical protein [Thauera sp. Sel9]